MFTDHLFDELVRVAVVAPTRVYVNPIEAHERVALALAIDVVVEKTIEQDIAAQVFLVDWTRDKI
jgi:hypothetical protein